MKKTAFWLLMALILVSSVFAATKPIAGQVVHGFGTIKLFVEIDFLGNSQFCIIDPLVETGPDGSFATNLGNLVFQNFPQMKCDGFWQAGNKIWYEIEHANGLNQSQIETIKPGTGLQYLENLIFPAPPAPEVPVTPSTGGSGGGGSSSPPAKPAPETSEIIELPAAEKLAVDVGLNAQQTKKLIEALLGVSLLSGPKKDLSAKIILSEFFNEKILATQTSSFSLVDHFEKNYVFDLASLPPGQYKLQAFVYDRAKLIGLSPIVKFVVAAPETQELIELPTAVAEKFKYSPYWYLLIILVVIIIAIIIWRLKKK